MAAGDQRRGGRTTPLGAPANGAGVRTPRAVRELTSGTRVLVTATIAGLGLAPLVLAIVTWRQGWQPTGDVAIIGFRSLDAWTRHAPLVGQPTTGDTYASVASSHPGPVEYWLLGPFLRVLGPALGLLVGTAAVNGAALAGSAWVAFRRGGTVLLGLVAVAAAALVRSLGAGALTDPFNSEVATFPMVLAVLAAWAVLAGDRRLLVVLAAAATVAAQVHVAGATAVAPVLLVVIVGLTGQIRAGRWAPRRDPNPLWAAGVVLLVGWLPVLIRELGGPSNVSALVRTAGAPHSRIGLPFALDRFLASLAPPPLFVRAPRDVAFLGTAGPVGLLLAALVAGGTVALLLTLRSQGRGQATWPLLVLIGAVSTASLWTSATAPPISILRSDVTRSTWVISLLVWVLAAWTGWQLIGPDVRRRVGPHVLPVSAALALVLVALTAAGADRTDGRDGAVMPAVEQLGDRTVAEVPAGTYELSLQGGEALFTIGPGLALRLVDAGRDVRFAPSPFATAYGRHRELATGTTPARLRVTTGADPEPEPGERLVAEAELPAPSTDTAYVFLRS